MVRTVLEVVCSPQEAQNGMGWTEGEINLVIYTDERRIAGWDHEWVQYELKVMLARLHRMGMESNLEKTKVVVCTPRFIWGKWWETAYKRWVKG